MIKRHDKLEGSARSTSRGISTLRSAFLSAKAKGVPKKETVRKPSAWEDFKEILRNAPRNPFR